MGNDPIDLSEFSRMVSEISSEESFAEDDKLNTVIETVNNYETLLLALCPVEYSSNILDTQKHCYTEPTLIPDASQYDVSTGENFDMGEFQHFDTMFFRWRAGNLIHVWNRLMLLPPLEWGLMMKVALSNCMQALRTYRAAMNHPDNVRYDPGRIGDASQTFNIFYDMSPFSQARSAECDKVMDGFKSLIGPEIDQENIPNGYEATFDQESERIIIELLGSSLLGISECFFDMCCITAEMLMQTAKMYQFETEDDHKHYIRAFCTTTREQVLERFYE